MEALRQQAAKIIDRFVVVAAEVPRMPRGVLLSEALAFCAATELCGAKAIVESGIYNGRSTEIWARFFPLMPITAIDKNISISARTRLLPLDNLALVESDSHEVLLPLVRDFGRVAVFIDGPKDHEALDLALACMEQDNVVLAAVHDISVNTKARARLDEMTTPKFISDEQWFVNEYAWLDTNESQWDEEQGTRWLPYWVENRGKPNRELGSYGYTIACLFKEGCL
jgi:hypothetical protein